jgi:hypothetical protein
MYAELMRKDFRCRHRNIGWKLKLLDCMDCNRRLSLAAFVHFASCT